jgi:hypothetical protein
LVPPLGVRATSIRPGLTTEPNGEIVVVAEDVTVRAYLIPIFGHSIHVMGRTAVSRAIAAFAAIGSAVVLVGCGSPSANPAARALGTIQGIATPCFSLGDFPKSVTVEVVADRKVEATTTASWRSNQPITRAYRYRVLVTPGDYVVRTSAGINARVVVQKDRVATVKLLSRCF